VISNERQDNILLGILCGLPTPPTRVATAAAPGLQQQRRVTAELAWRRRRTGQLAAGSITMHTCGNP